MKTNRLVFTLTLSTGLLALQAFSDQPPAASKPASGSAPAPATKPAPRNSAREATAKKTDAAKELRTVPLVPGPAVVDARNVNVRGQAKINSEVVTRLTKGDAVTVIEEVLLKRSGPDEPSAWAKIAYPTNVHVWAHKSFIDATNKTVIPRRLNVRTGAGENYSVAGSLQRGDAVKEIRIKDNWMEIESPANAYAFMAAQYLKQEAPAKPETPSTPPATATVAETTPIAPPPSPSEPAPTPPPAVLEPEKKDEPPPKRIVQREGVVKGTWSIQAPTHYALVSPDNGKTINYLYTSSRDLDLSRYKGLRIIVTGEEGLDERWKNTPLITIQRIQVLE